ncbi:MAG TPA: hypothetical protein VLH08_11000, partial [Acidobacteriota bacterium]|nr:hypothetical protein [Acidobacteriota bacterium]
GEGFFQPEVLEDFYTFRWMNSYGKLTLIANQRLRGNLSFALYSEPYRRYVSLFLDGRSIGQERAKIRGMPVNITIGLHKGRNILELREPETYPGKKPPTEEDRTGRIYKVEQLQFTPIEYESVSGN